MKNLFLSLVLCFAYTLIGAQPLITRSGYISFFSKTPLEDIKGENSQVNAAIDLAKKKIAFAALMKSFLFEKALMQEHFNENYIESDKYPKASFVGSFIGDVNSARDGNYPINIQGTLTLHGVTRPIEVPATIEVRQGKLIGEAKFKIRPSDYNIKIPAVVKDKISQQLVVTVKTEHNLSK